MLVEAVNQRGTEMMSTLTASEEEIGVKSSILAEQPNCELVELYRWNDHGVDHIVYMGLDGNRYKFSKPEGRQNAHWELCIQSGFSVRALSHAVQGSSRDL